MSDDRDILRIAVELSYVVVHEFDGRTLIEQAIVSPAIQRFRTQKA